MRINPVLENEMKRSMRSVKTSWIIFAVNLLLTIVAVTTYFGIGGPRGYLTSGQFRFPVRCYMMMAYVLFAMVCLLVPGVAGGSIVIERERRTLDILLTTQLSPWKIIIGKLEASLCMIFLISALPAVSLILVFGGVSLWDLLMLVCILVVSGIYVGSIGIFCSAIMKKATVATITSYTIVLALMAGTILIIMAAGYLMGIRAEQMGDYGAINIGSWIYIMLLNPLVSYFGLLTGQVGSGYELLELLSRVGEYSGDFIVVHMLVISMTVQMLISCILLILAGININPLRK